MANQPSSPPPGSVPGSFSPGEMDMDEMMGQMGGSTGKNPSASSLPGSTSQPAKNPRSIGNPAQEAQYLAEGVGQGMLALLPDFMQELLGIKDSDSPEEKARKRQIFQNYQKLNAEDQAYVQKKMQQEQIEKQRREQEEEQKRQQAAMNDSGDLPMPAGRVTGAGAEGSSNKQRTTQKLNDDRKKLSNQG